MWTTSEKKIKALFGAGFDFTRLDDGDDTTVSSAVNDLLSATENFTKPKGKDTALREATVGELWGVIEEIAELEDIDLKKALEAKKEAAPEKTPSAPKEPAGKKPEPVKKKRRVRPKPSAKPVSTYESGKPYKKLAWEKIADGIYGVKMHEPFKVKWRSVTIPGRPGDYLIAWGKEMAQLSVLVSASVANLRRMGTALEKLREEEPKPKSQPTPKAAKKQKQPPVSKEGSPTRLRVVRDDKESRPDYNMSPMQAIAVAKMIDEYRRAGKGLKVEKAGFVKDSENLFLFVYDTSAALFPRQKVEVSKEGKKLKPYAKRLRLARQVIASDVIKNWYSTKENSDACSRWAKDIFTGKGEAADLGRKLMTCGDLDARKIRIDMLHKYSKERYEKLKRAKLTVAQKDGGYTYGEVMSITAAQFLRDEKMQEQFTVKQLVGLLDERRSENG